MALLFHPRGRLGARIRDQQVVEVPDARVALLRDAIAQHITGETKRYRRLFTADVTCETPHFSTRSRAEMEATLGTLERSLSDQVLLLTSWCAFEHLVAVEWVLRARLAGPVLYEDDLLIEPTFAIVEFDGASFGEFRGTQISSIRHYFDDTQLLAQVSGTVPVSSAQLHGAHRWGEGTGPGIHRQALTPRSEWLTGRKEPP